MSAAIRESPISHLMDVLADAEDILDELGVVFQSSANEATAMLPASARQTNNSIVQAVKGIGAQWVRQLDRTYDVGKMRATLKEALTTEAESPNIIVASSAC